MSQYVGRQSLHDIDWLLTDLMKGKVLPPGLSWWLAGSARRAQIDRGAKMVGDVDLVVWGPETFSGLPWTNEWRWSLKKASRWVEVGGKMAVHLDVWLSPADSVGPFSLFLTGPMQFNVWMRQKTRPDMMLTQYGLFDRVPKPTKMYPGRTVAGARQDDPFVVTNWREVHEAERKFWKEWCWLNRFDLPLPSPWMRHPEGFR